VYDKCTLDTKCLRVSPSRKPKPGEEAVAHLKDSRFWKINRPHPGADRKETQDPDLPEGNLADETYKARLIERARAGTVSAFITIGRGCWSCFRAMDPPASGRP